jgi:hypothetical protein
MRRERRDHRAGNEHQDRKDRGDDVRMPPSLQGQPPQPGIEGRDDGEMAAIDDADRAAHLVIAQQPVGHRQQHDRQQEQQIEDDERPGAIGPPRQPAVMADPVHAGDNEAERQAHQPPGIDLGEIGPIRQRREIGLGQVIGEQGHRHTEDGVGQRFHPAHLEQVVGVRLGHAGADSGGAGLGMRAKHAAIPHAEGWMVRTLVRPVKKPSRRRLRLSRNGTILHREMPAIRGSFAQEDDSVTP